MLELNGTDVGYGSVAMAGPWRESHALYEFDVQPAHRMRTFYLFASLLAVCDVKIIEMQTNDRLLTTMLHTFTTNLWTEKILFEDGFETSYALPGAQFGRPARMTPNRCGNVNWMSKQAGWSPLKVISQEQAKGFITTTGPMVKST